MAVHWICVQLTTANQPGAVLVTALIECVRAGFPSPAEDLGASRIDVLAHLIVHPAATYSMTVRGDSMKEYGIFDHDTLLIDRAIRPKHGHIIVANLDNEFVCKFLYKRNGMVKLKAGNPTHRVFSMNQERRTPRIHYQV